MRQDQRPRVDRQSPGEQGAQSGINEMSVAHDHMIGNQMGVLVQKQGDHSFALLPFQPWPQQAQYLAGVGKAGLIVRRYGIFEFCAHFIIKAGADGRGNRNLLRNALARRTMPA